MARPWEVRGWGLGRECGVKQCALPRLTGGSDSRRMCVSVAITRFALRHSLRILRSVHWLVSHFPGILRKRNTRLWCWGRHYHPSLVEPKSSQHLKDLKCCLLLKAWGRRSRQVGRPKTNESENQITCKSEGQFIKD